MPTLTPLPPDTSRNDAHAFMPILVEIEDRPISPAGRTLFWLVLALFVFVVVWSCIGEVDVVISGPGKLVPQGRTKVLQPLEAGIVRAIYVKEGQWVKKGQPMVELDPSIVDPSLEALSQNLRYARLERDRLNAQLQGQPFLPSDTLDAEATAYLSAQQLLFDASRQTLADQLQNRQEQLRQVSEQLAAARAEGQSARNLMQLERDKQARMAPVRDLLPKTAYDPVDQSLEEFQNRQIEAVHRAAELTHRQGQLQQEMSALQQAWRKDLLDQLATVQKRVIELEAQQRQLTFRRQKAVLVAPDDGVVDQVLFNTVGGVVSPAQTLLSIVPSNVPLVVEAVVQNKDVGYLRPGLPVTVKVDTFDFQKYGAVSGKLQRISQDSTGGSMLPASGGGPTAASSPAVAPADGQRPTFKATIALPRPWLRVEGKIASLHPGMTVNAEMKVGKRRVIEFFLSPVLKSLKESINVR